MSVPDRAHKEEEEYNIYRFRRAVSHGNPIKWSTLPFPRGTEPGKLFMSAGSCLSAQACSTHSRHMDDDSVSTLGRLVGTVYKLILSLL